MKKLLKPFKSKAMLQIALFAALFGVMSHFMEMMEQTEEQTTYSITLENLASANIEADGENAGGCEVSLACSVLNPAQNYIKCSGTTCERNASERWVKCDGNKTSC